MFHHHHNHHYYDGLTASGHYLGVTHTLSLSLYTLTHTHILPTCTTQTKTKRQKSLSPKIVPFYCVLRNTMRLTLYIAFLAQVSIYGRCSLQLCFLSLLQFLNWKRRLPYLRVVFSSLFFSIISSLFYHSVSFFFCFSSLFDKMPPGLMLHAALSKGEKSPPPILKHFAPKLNCN